jgi:hypothetical protein
MSPGHEEEGSDLSATATTPSECIEDSREDEDVKPTPLPMLQLLSVLSIQFAEPITALCVYPFVNQFVRETGITKGDETKTGYYAGLIVRTCYIQVRSEDTVFNSGPRLHRNLLSFYRKA